MDNHYVNGQELSMALSDAVVNGPWPSQPARPYERFADLAQQIQIIGGHPTGVGNMDNHYGNGQELSMARSDAVVNAPWPSQPVGPSERLADLRKQVLQVVTFVRLLDADESTMHDKRLMSIDEANDDIAIHDIAMTSLDVNIPDISMSSLSVADVSMVSAGSMMEEGSDGNQQN